MNEPIYLVHFDSNRVPQKCKTVKSQRRFQMYRDLWHYEPVSPERYNEIQRQLIARALSDAIAKRKAKKKARTS